MKNVVRFGLLILGPVLLGFGGWLGLSWAPPDREMGDVQRIMYVHVPAVWMMLIGFFLNFLASVGFLMTSRMWMDAFAEATAEVGLLFGTIGILLGSIWARPTWGVWWDWDPRLTAVAIVLVLFAGYGALRKFMENPDRRAVLSAVSSILIGVGLPIIWFSVKYFNSLHQQQSSPKTTDHEMAVALRVGAFAFLAVFITFVWERYEQALATQARELAVPDKIPAEGAR